MSRIDNFYTAKEIAQKFEVTESTVLNWERKGILKVACRTPTGRKYYAKFDVDKLYRRGFEEDGDSTDTGI